ncbi:MAG: hypothetical protein JRI34_03255 [Deltaproteobacteria bacterium]|nr:hypothetical protein [Deltaproteobacteria bacterium]
MKPDVKSEIIAGPLANVSVAYRNLEYIADRVFPILDGADPKAKITKYRKGAWFRDEAGIRAAGTRAKRGGYPLTSVSVSTNEYAFAKEVTDEDRRFAKSQGAPVLNPDQDALEFAADKVDLKKEIRVAELITSGTWADGNAGGEDAEGLWSPAGDTNTFLADIATGKKKIKECGVIANGLLIDFATYLALKEADDILEKIKYTQKGVFGAALLAALLELDEVLVGKAVKSTAEETAAGDDFTAVDIWEVNAGKGMGFLYYRPKKIGLKTPTAGLQVRIAYENGLARRTSTWRENAEHQDVYEVAEETDIVQVAADCGYLWKDTYAT